MPISFETVTIQLQSVPMMAKLRLKEWANLVFLLGLSDSLWLLDQARFAMAVGKTRWALVLEWHDLRAVLCAEEAHQSALEAVEDACHAELALSAM